jgi:hypothetical protein
MVKKINFMVMHGTTTTKISSFGPINRVKLAIILLQKIILKIEILTNHCTLCENEISFLFFIELGVSNNLTTTLYFLIFTVMMAKLNHVTSTKH